VAARRVLRRPVTADADRAARSERIESELASLAVDVLHQLLADEATPEKVRLDAAKAVLDRAGHGPRRASAEPGARPLSEMTIEELERIARSAAEP
jgi:hypothetical protein